MDMCLQFPSSHAHTGRVRKSLGPPNQPAQEREPLPEPHPPILHPLKLLVPLVCLVEEAVDHVELPVVSLDLHSSLVPESILSLPRPFLDVLQDRLTFLVLNALALLQRRLDPFAGAQLPGVIPSSGWVELNDVLFDVVFEGGR